MWQFYVVSNLYVNLCRVVRIATILRAVRGRGSNSNRGKMILLFSKNPDRDWRPRSPLMNKYYGSFPVVNILAGDVPILRICIPIIFIKLLIKHAPLPWIILHAVGIQLGSISGDTVAIITRSRQSLYSLYNSTALVTV